MQSSDILFLILVFFIPTLQESMLINHQRTSNLQSFCLLSKQQLIAQMSNDQISQYQQYTNASFNIDGSDFMIKIFQGSSILSELQNNVGNIVLYFGFFAVPLVLMIVMFPFLICCCLCPNKCPCCQGCRQPSDEPYTSSQKTCPGAIVIVLSVLVISLFIASSLLKIPIWSMLDKTKCSIAITYDNLLNGNISINDSNSYFTGTVMADNAMKNITNQLDEIKANTESISSTGQEIEKMMALFESLQQSTVKVPSDSGEKLELQYKTPFLSSTTTGNTDSLFPNTLGISTIRQSLVGRTYLALRSTKAALQQISQLADRFKIVIDDLKKFNSSIIEDISQINSDIKSYDKAFADLDNDSENIQLILYIIVYATISLGGITGIIMIIGVSCIICSKKLKCRYLTYLTCVIFYVTGIILFVLAIGFSLLTPGSYFLCTYLRTGVSTPELFKSNFQPVLGKQTAQTFSPCANEGNGQIAINLIGQQTLDFFKSRQEIIEELEKFDFKIYQLAMNEAAEDLALTTQNYLNARILDFNSQDELESLKKVSKASQYSSCSSLGFTQDSWIPSIKQNPLYVFCQISDGAQVDINQCPIPSVKDDKCSGCLDTFNIFEQKQKSEVFKVLTDRYPEAGCIEFADELSNVWANFYKIKSTVITPVSQRTQNLKTKIKDVNFTPTQNNFQTVSKSLNHNLDVLLAPSTGLIAGLNCRVLTEDIQLVIGTVCNNILEFSYVMRILLGVAGWAIMVISCLMVCVGVRAYRLDIEPKVYGSDGSVMFESGHQLKK